MLLFVVRSRLWLFVVCRFLRNAVVLVRAVDVGLSWFVVVCRLWFVDCCFCLYCLLMFADCSLLMSVVCSFVCVSCSLCDVRRWLLCVA